MKRTSTILLVLLCPAFLAGCEPGPAADDGVGPASSAAAEGAILPFRCTSDAQCNDRNACTTDRCKWGRCVFTPVADGTACQDGSLCTLGDTCRRGVCTGGPALRCTPLDACHRAGTCNPKTGLCSNPLAKNGTACQDGNACTTRDACRTGVCVGGPARDCNDGDACTADSCDPARGCLHATFCDDGNACTTDGCAGGICHFSDVPAGTPCEDGNPCSTAAACLPAPGEYNLRCLPSASVDCDDGDPCTPDACDPDTGECTHGAPCSDAPECHDVQCLPGQGCAWVGYREGQPCDGPGGCVTGGTCGYYQCEAPAGACDDHNPCTDDLCDPFLGTCQHTPRTCDEGNPCTDDQCVLPGGECLHQYRGDGATCRSGNIGSCVPGTCTGGVCRFDLYYPGPTCDDGDPCTFDECDPKTGECVHAPISCDDGYFCTVESCDTATGGCLSEPREDGTPCGEAGAPCQEGATCQSGGCMWVERCDDGDPCTMDYCESRGTTWACHHVKPFCDDANPCTDEVCDPATGGCVPVPKADGAPCDDRNGCTEGDQCAGGQCLGVDNGCSDGNLCTWDECAWWRWPPACEHGPACDDGNPCTQDECDPNVGVCQHVPLPEDSPCDDGNVCTRTGCRFGECVTLDLVNCSDDDPCTLDLCDSWVGCQHGELCPDDGDSCTLVHCEPALAACVMQVEPDGTPCTSVYVGPAWNTECMGGRCQGTTTNCWDGDPCTYDWSDGWSCHHDVFCIDGDPCTLDGCDPVGNCLWTPAPDGTPCDDGDGCTIGDVCAAGACQRVMANCDDGDACTWDQCYGWWVGSYGYVCDHQPVSCEDTNPCTTDGCDAVAGCFHVPVQDGEPCDDGSLCTVGDTCAAGSCGVPVDCDDHDPCTDDMCIPWNGECSNMFRCLDGNPCTTDLCDEAGQCTYAVLEDGAACDDGNLCTTGDACSAGACRGSPAACGDGDPCTEDWCDEWYGCQHYSPCNDGNVCTAERCDGDPYNCWVEPLADGTPCDDWNVCTLNDGCTAGTCAGTPADCSDTDPCTQDLCQVVPGAEGEPVTWECSHPPVDCDDGDDCTADRCDAEAGCVHEALPGLEGATCHRGCGGPCGDDFTMQACAAGACTDQEACAGLPVAWGPVASFTSLQMPADLETVRGTCFDFTGDGLGDSGLKGLAGQLNGAFSDMVMSGAYIALLEFPAGTDFANALPFPLAALTGRSDSQPPQPMGPVHAARISYQSSCDPVDEFPEAAIADGVLTGTASRLWIRMPDAFLAGDEPWPALLVLRDVRLRARVVQGGPDGVELAEGVLGARMDRGDLESFIDHSEAHCQQAEPAPGYCSYLSMMRSILTLLLDLHCFDDGTCVPKSAELRGNTASLCLTFSAMPAFVTGVVPAP